jgi:hypothetical protein
VPLDQLSDRSPSNADHVLLVCFGLEPAGTRSGRELGLALQHAGYSGALARHVVRTSPLLVNVAQSRFRGQRYRLRRCTE